MNFQKLVLIVSGVAWAGFGVFLFVYPETLSSVGVPVDSGLGRTEIRAFYGGLEIGLGVFLLWSQMRAERIHVGLMAALLTVGATGTGRLLGVALEGFETSGLMWGFIAIEWTALAVTALAISKHRHPAADVSAQA